MGAKCCDKSAEKTVPFFLCGIAFILVGKDFLAFYFSLLCEFTLSTAWVYIILLCQGSSIVERINAKQCLCCAKVLCSGYVVTLNISAFLKNGGPQYIGVSRWGRALGVDRQRWPCHNETFESHKIFCKGYLWAHFLFSHCGSIVWQGGHLLCFPLWMPVVVSMLWAV